jgi:CheY-like chemotaxis protein
MFQSMASPQRIRREESAHARYSALPSGASVGRPTILVVDDELVIAQLLAEVLSDAGYEVLTATNGRTGLAISRAIHPELVLTDYMLPALDGIRLVHELRRHPATRDVPVVLMSCARPGKDELRDVPFLAKPFDLDEVLEIVARHIASPADEAPLRSAH